MREIKFRFWDGKQMIYHGYEEADCYFHGILVCEGDTVPLQFTGLKDKNGNEIYEGDLLKIHVESWVSGIKQDEEDSTNEIGFKNGAFWLIGNNKADFPYLCAGCSLTWLEEELCFDVLKESEVIGNIYENPELLI